MICSISNVNAYLIIFLENLIIISAKDRILETEITSNNLL